MGVRELNRDQLAELKCQYLQNLQGNLSYDEIADIDSYVSDEEVFGAYSGYSFSRDDFSSESDPGSDYSLELGECLGDRWAIASELRQIADAIENGYYSGTANYGTNWSIM